MQSASSRGLNDGDNELGAAFHSCLTQTLIEKLPRHWSVGRTSERTHGAQKDGLTHNALRVRPHSKSMGISQRTEAVGTRRESFAIRGARKEAGGSCCCYRHHHQHRYGNGRQGRPEGDDDESSGADEILRNHKSLAVWATDGGGAG
ncbi:unnamed protein product [Boreogadus saida]